MVRVCEANLIIITFKLILSLPTWQNRGYFEGWLKVLSSNFMLTLCLQNVESHPFLFYFGQLSVTRCLSHLFSDEFCVTAQTKFELYVYGIAITIQYLFCIVTKLLQWYLNLTGVQKETSWRQPSKKLFLPKISITKDRVFGLQCANFLETSLRLLQTFFAGNIVVVFALQFVIFHFKAISYPHVRRLYLP